jgi:hypothetical protein
MDPDLDPRHSGERIRILQNDTDPYGSGSATLHAVTPKYEYQLCTICTLYYCILEHRLFGITVMYTYTCTDKVYCI